MITMENSLQDVITGTYAAIGISYKIKWNFWKDNEQATNRTTENFTAIDETTGKILISHFNSQSIHHVLWREDLLLLGLRSQR